MAGLFLRLSLLTVELIGTTCPPVSSAVHDSLETALLEDARDGELDGFELLEASLIASGVETESRLEALRREFADLSLVLSVQLTESGYATDRAELIFKFLHAEVLSGDYESDCTEIHEALTNGNYNCVSATVLYLCLCRSQGLSPSTVATDTHLRSRFEAVEPFDVETTCRDWFDIARRDGSAQFVRTQLQSTRELSDVQLLGKIFYNRGVSLLEAKQFPAAMELLRRGLLLDAQDGLAQQNLLAATNNWALAECDAGRFEMAADLIHQGLRNHPAYEPFLTNDIHIHQQWAVALCRQQRFKEAFAVLQESHRRRPEVELFAHGRFAVCRDWAETLLASARYDEYWQFVRETRFCFADAPQAVVEQCDVILRAAEHLAQAGDEQTAADLFRRASVEWTPPNQDVVGCEDIKP